MGRLSIGDIDKKFRENCAYSTGMEIAAHFVGKDLLTAPANGIVKKLTIGQHMGIVKKLTIEFLGPAAQIVKNLTKLEPR